MRLRFICSFSLALIVGFFVAMPLTQAQDVVISEKTKEKFKDEKFKDEKFKEVVKHKEFCSNNNWSNGDKVSFNELREMTVPASGKLDVDGARNGGISIRGENRSDVLVRACVQAWSTSDEAAKSLAASVRINTNGLIKAAGSDENGWSVSYDILTPKNTSLNLKAHNGGISIKSVDGSIDLVTVNGGVSIYDAAGDVRGRTTNGGINVSLVGSGWKGSGLDLQTTNGGVNLTIPENFAANVEAGTVNGGFSSDIPALNVEKSDRHQAKRVNASINGGGPPVRIVTTNGGIRISSGEKSIRY